MDGLFDGRDGYSGHARCLLTHGGVWWCWGWLSVLPAGAVGFWLRVIFVTFIVIGLGLFGDLDGSAADVEGSTRVASDNGDFTRRELDGILVHYIAWDAFEAGGYDGHELFVVVAWKGDRGQAKPTADLVT